MFFIYNFDDIPLLNLVHSVLMIIAKFEQIEMLNRIEKCVLAHTDDATNQVGIPIIS